MLLGFLTDSFSFSLFSLSRLFVSVFCLSFLYEMPTPYVNVKGGEGGVEKLVFSRVYGNEAGKPSGCLPSSRGCVPIWVPISVVGAFVWNPTTSCWTGRISFYLFAGDRE